jgi:hypothetical protein
MRFGHFQSLPKQTHPKSIEITLGKRWKQLLGQ